MIVATTAFGLGVHRPDIRHIYRVGYANSLEEFVQEAGRAGRDGEPAAATLLAPPDINCVKLFSPPPK